MTVGIEFRLDCIRRHAFVARRAGADEPKVVQKRAAEGGMEEMVGQRVALCVLPELCLASVVEAHGKASGIGIGSELVHEPAVDLLLLVIKAVKQVTRCLAYRNESVDIEGLIRQILRKATIDFGLVTCALQHAWQKRIGVPIRIELNLGRSGGGNAVGIREETEQIIEAVILEIDDDDVLDIAELRG
jgi:hypothetical protein